MPRLRGRSARPARRASLRRCRDRPARLERVAVSAASRGGRGDRQRAARARTATRTRPRRCCAAAWPSATRSTRRGSPSGTAPARSCSPPPRRSASPGAEILYAWPAFSIYPHLARALRRPRDPRAAGRGRRPRPRRDAGRDHRGDPARARLQPQQPDRDPHPGGADRATSASASRPRHGDPRRGLRRVPDRRRPRRDASTCCATSPTWSLLRTFSKVLRAGRPAGRLRARLGRASAPPSTRCASRSASTRSPRRPPPRRSCTATTSPSGSRRRSPSASGSRRGLRELGLETPTPRRTSPGSRSATATRAGRRRPRRAGIAVRGRARRWAAPATSGSPTGPPAENERFLAALARGSLDRLSGRAPVLRTQAPCYKGRQRSRTRLTRTEAPSGAALGLPACPTVLAI